MKSQIENDFLTRVFDACIDETYMARIITG